jgi:uncharacterized membrane protein
MHTKSKYSSWRKFFNFWTKTPWHALLGIVLIVALILSGILNVLANDFVTNVFEPLLVVVVLCAILVYIVNPGKRK